MSLDDAIAEAAATLRGGGLVAFPTETVYGLGANALDPDAAARIFAAKGRPHFDPLIVHVADRERAIELVTEFPANALRLAEHFWPGPLTLVLRKSKLVPDIVTAGQATVALRVPRHPIALELLRLAGVPIAAPSANRFGCTSPTTAAHVRAQLGNEIDMILDGGPCQVGIESTILSFADGPPTLLRPGGTSLAAIEKLLGEVRLLEDHDASVQAPGRQNRHYATQTPLLIADSKTPHPHGPRVGLIAFSPIERPEHFAAIEILSHRGDLTEAASRLFAAMHRLDALGLDLIVAHKVPESGLGMAIMDRLRRASCRDA